MGLEGRVEREMKKGAGNKDGGEKNWIGGMRE